MGDQKDHATIQKKDVESAESQVESQDFEMATEAIDPPSLQLKVEESSEKEEGSEGEKEISGAYQFALASPPDPPTENSSRALGSEPIQGKGIAEPFKMPIVQKKEQNTSREGLGDKPSFTL